MVPTSAFRARPANTTTCARRFPNTGRLAIHIHGVTRAVSTGEHQVGIPTQPDLDAWYALRSQVRVVPGLAAASR